MARPTTTSSGPTGQPFFEPGGPSEELLARWAGTCRWDLSRPDGPGWENGWPFGPFTVASPQAVRSRHVVPEGVPEGSRGFRNAVPPERDPQIGPEPREGFQTAVIGRGGGIRIQSTNVIRGRVGQKCQAMVADERRFPILWNPDRGSACVGGRLSGGRASLQPPATFLCPFRAVVDGPDGVRVRRCRWTISGRDRVGDVGVGSDRACVRPNGPTVSQTVRATRRIVGPLGRDTSLGSFPARWAGLGEWLALWAGPWLVLCPLGRGFSDECPWERTQRSAPPPPCYWPLERRPDRSGVAMSRLPGTHCRTKLLSGSLLTSDDHH